MANDLPAWVAELTDPRRATALDELADRLVPLAEHAIDVSRRLQTLLSDLNDPFKRDALYGLVERLNARCAAAHEEIVKEISASGRERVERILAAGRERGLDDAAASALGQRLDADVVPALAEQERAVAAQVSEHMSKTLEIATQRLLTRVEELAAAVTDLLGDVLPLARDGLDLAGRISDLSGRARRAGRGGIPADLGAEAIEVAAAFEETVARLELEWSALGARAATVRAAVRGAEEAAVSEVTGELTDCVEDLAPAHIAVLDETEARALALIEEIGPS
ncbi:MAG: hypothetical protein ACRDOO_15585 [Actinomadura sp.]